MKKIIFAILTLFFFQNAYASEDSSNNEGSSFQSTDHDATCHWCRKSKNRIRQKTLNYQDCNHCKKSYCESCVTNQPEIAPTKTGCLHCQQECCCQTECTKEHKCCHTLVRTKKRHADNPTMTSYKKKKCEEKDEKEILTEDGNLCIEFEVNPALPTDQATNTNEPSFILSIEPVNPIFTGPTLALVNEPMQDSDTESDSEPLIMGMEINSIHPSLNDYQILNLAQSNLVHFHFVPLSTFLPPWNLTYPYFPNVNGYAYLNLVQGAMAFSSF